MPRYQSTRPGKHGPEPRPVAERFWGKVDRRGPNDCWLWTASVGTNGYGKFGGADAHTAHRMAWLLTRGPIPDGLVVCHACDENYPPGDTSYRLCVNPRHLWLGSKAENLADMRAKGRDRYVPSGVRGEQHGKSKLRDIDVLDIRMAVACHETIKDVARRYRVSTTTIHRIVNRELWTHLP